MRLQCGESWMRWSRSLLVGPASAQLEPRLIALDLIAVFSGLLAADESPLAANRCTVVCLGCLLQRFACVQGGPDSGNGCKVGLVLILECGRSLNSLHALRPVSVKWHAGVSFFTVLCAIYYYQGLLPDCAGQQCIGKSCGHGVCLLRVAAPAVVLPGMLLTAAEAVAHSVTMFICTVHPGVGSSCTELCFSRASCCH